MSNAAFAFSIDPLKVNLSQSQVDRFWSLVEKTDECWLWNGSKKQMGYGLFMANNRRFLAHRLSFFMRFGKLGNELVLHRCDNPSCVNPDHLFLGSHQDNASDKVSKGRQSKGSRTGVSKLTEEQVLDLRRRFKNGERPWDVSMEIGMSFRATKEAMMGKSWKHLLTPQSLL